MGLSLWGGRREAALYMTLLPYTFPRASVRYARGFLALCCALCSVLGFVLCRRERGIAVIHSLTVKKVFYICVPLSFRPIKE